MEYLILIIVLLDVLNVTNWIVIGEKGPYVHAGTLV
jgi:hypothetical protein